MTVRLVRPVNGITQQKTEPDELKQYGSYSEYLASPRWSGLRRESLERDGNRCRVCNSSKSLDVHHRQYPKIWGEEDVTYLTTLCSYCHDLFSLQKKNTKKTVKHVMDPKKITREYKYEEWIFVLSPRKKWTKSMKRKFKRESVDPLEVVRKYLRCGKVTELYGI